MPNEILPVEHEALVKFRAKIADALPQLNEYKRNDMWLLRWLRARELNVDKAEDMFRKYLKWRIDYKMDEIGEWRAPEFIQEEFPFQVTGFDRDGCVAFDNFCPPVGSLVRTTIIEPSGAPDGSIMVNQLPLFILGLGIFEKTMQNYPCFELSLTRQNLKLKKIHCLSMGLKEDFVRYAAQILEVATNFLEYVSSEEMYVYQFVAVLDFEGFSIKQVLSKEALDIAADIIRMFEGYYPEVLKSCWAVNAPKFFEIAFNIIKPLLTARTLEKIHIHGSNSDQWRASLLKRIDADQLPSRAGGSKTTCKNYKLQYGFEIFPWYDTLRETEMTSTPIAAGKKYTKDYEIQKGHSISWNFRSDYDIGFALLFKQKGENSTETLFACDKADAHLHLQRGAILAERAGTYTLVFDNSGSWRQGKTVHFGVRIKPEVWSCYCTTSVVTATHSTK